MRRDPEAVDVSLAMDMARGIAAARAPRRAATQVCATQASATQISSDDILDLALAVTALDAIARAAASWIAAREELFAAVLGRDDARIRDREDESENRLEELLSLLSAHKYIAIEQEAHDE